MKMFKIVLIFILVGVFSFGAVCGGKQKPTLTPPKAVERPMEDVGLDKAPVESVEPPEVGVESLVFENIYFDYDKYDLEQEALGTLGGHADRLRDNPDVRIRIEGHCDDRGTEQYNLALGEKRAYEAKKFLIGAGIPEDRIEIISYGEERPVNPGQNESTWAKNRRAEFKILK